MDEEIFYYAGEYTGRSPVEFHTHTGAELVFQAAGVCRHELADGRTFCAEPHAVFAVPPHCPHRQFSLTPARTIYIVCRTPFPAVRLFPDSHEPFVASAFTEILTAWQGGRAHHRLIIDGLLRTLTGWMEQTAAPSPAPEACAPEALLRARAYIEANFCENIRLETMARECGLSHSYLTAEFRKIWGETPKQYLLRKRLELAARLLIDPRRNVKETARQCGFSGTNYFTRCFHAVYKQTPTAYRTGKRN